ncbi:hypothetical protein SAMN04488074_106237 [Lentzea albidocapillata subsp. violacea]|uniref:Flagellar basal body-associated protein FliL n=1 Tax=Lentzea albidocapillata subsp. violacea TaxID=128104 RepID=A0A1G9DEG2_9PSEU|nr:hypothetical protein [Lentzea albidocapillata]SDK62281.1 hypothetical protein SAMN04488074_106237 [Lentzea albidocapillata subsp. violacea]
MTWQEELQKLDLELASGRISADDYRQRRDEVLAGSTSAPPQPQQQAPFAAPFRWQAMPPQQQAPNPDATQVVSTGQAAPNPDATQVVNTQKAGDSERTQFVRPVSGPEPQQGGWQSGPSAPPPWVGGDGGFGPMGGSTPGWIAQGPETFDDAGKSSGKGRIFAIVGVVLVLALIGGGIWWFTTQSGGGGNGGETTAQTTTQTTSTKPKPKDDLDIVALPGSQEDQSGIKTFEDIVAQKLLTEEENAVYATGGATKARVAVSKLPNGDVIQVITVQLTDATAATTAREALAALQTKFNMKTYTGGTIPEDVSAHQIDVEGDKKGSARAHYVHKSTLVRLQVAGKDQAAISKDFDSVLAAQLEFLPSGS